MNQCFENSNFTGFLHEKGKTTEKKDSSFFFKGKLLRKSDVCIIFTSLNLFIEFLRQIFFLSLYSFSIQQSEYNLFWGKIGGKHLKTNASNEINVIRFISNDIVQSTNAFHFEKKFKKFCDYRARLLSYYLSSSCITIIELVFF